MKCLVFVIVLVISLSSFAQEKIDTIYTYAKPIAAKVKEVSDQEVFYTLPNEAVVYRLNKRTVQRIVFSSGRTEVFSQKNNLPDVRTAKDWRKVELTTLPAEVANLLKIGMVSVKATGPLTVSSVTRTQNRAFRKLKYAAAMLGGDRVLITNQSVEGNILLFRSTRTQLTGIIYRTAPLDTTGLFKNVMGGRYQWYEHTFLNIDNAAFKQSLLPESIEIEVTPKNLECRDGVAYLKVDLGLGTKSFIVTFQSSTYIIAGHHSDSRFEGIVFKRVPAPQNGK